MEYGLLVLAVIIGGAGWIAAYLLHRELVTKEEFISDLLQENSKFASQLLREGAKKCTTTKKRGIKKGNAQTSHPA